LRDGKRGNDVAASTSSRQNDSHELKYKLAASSQS
jgi:hypothetical protein